MRIRSSRASLPVLQNWTDADYDRHLAGSAMRRASLPMLKRNASIAMENRQKGCVDK